MLLDILQCSIAPCNKDLAQNVDSVVVGKICVGRESAGRVKNSPLREVERFRSE